MVNIWVGISYDMISFACLSVAGGLRRTSVNIKRDHVFLSVTIEAWCWRKSHQTQRIIFIAQSLIEHQRAEFTSALSCCLVDERKNEWKKERKLLVLISGMGNCLKEKKCSRNLRSESRWISCKWTKAIFIWLSWSCDRCYDERRCDGFNFCCYISFIIIYDLKTSHYIKHPFPKPFCLFRSTYVKHFNDVIKGFRAVTTLNNSSPLLYDEFLRCSSIIVWIFWYHWAHCRLHKKRVQTILLR